MWTFLAPFIGKIFGFLLLALSVVFIYLGIKNKGKQEERAKWEKATNEAKEKIKEKVLEAVSKDSEIDKSVAKEKLRITTEHETTTDSNPTKPGDRFRF